MTNDVHVRALSCAEVLDLAPELGLEVGEGARPFDASQDSEGCPSCRAVVESTVRRVLLVGPDARPVASATL